MVDQVFQAIEKLGPAKLLRQDYRLRGVHVDAILGPEQLRSFAQILRERGFLLEDVTAVDASPDLMGVYHFAHPSGTCRVVGRVLVSRDNPALPSIHEVFPGANWHEREIHDFFGVVFTGHPDLSPLILPEDAGDLRPLRKSPENLKALSALIPEFAPPAPEGEATPRPEKKERPPKPEAES
jgi:NADH-quinone oxidoreductase subunit C